MDLKHRKRGHAAFARVIKEAGGFAHLGKVLGCTKQNLHITFSKGRPLPERYVAQVSERYGIAPHVLRPDKFEAL